MGRRIWTPVIVCLALAVFGGIRSAGRARRIEYRLLEGTEVEITAISLCGNESGGRSDGVTLYIVGGVHGDEKAGWMAGERLKDTKLSAGTLYIVSQANRYGAEADQRNTAGERDLNRNFPGDPNGCDAERIAWAIYSDIRDKKPDLVLDLHEARAGTGKQDALGNSLICQSLEGIEDLVLGILEQSSEGLLCSGAFTLYGSPPPGSINRVVAEELGIPVITVETFREDGLDVRVRNHLEIAEFVMRHYGLLRD